MEPVAKTTRIKVPINSTVKICKLEYAIKHHFQWDEGDIPALITLN